MKKLLLASLITLASTPALAIEGGKPLDWAEHDNLVRMECTGTIIGGKFVLTANHCVKKGQKLGAVVLANNATATIKKYYRPNHGNEEDISIWELASTPSVTAFDPLSMIPVAVGGKLRVSGFGENQTTPRTAIREVDYEDELIYGTKSIEQGSIDGGDSGGPNFLPHSNFPYDGIVSISVTAMPSVDGLDPATHTRLDYPPARKLILDSVNGWHYPTAVKTTTGKKEKVLIQSLFKDEEVIDLTNLSIEPSNSSIQVTVDPSCVPYEPRTNTTPATSSNVRPFDVCTLNIEANNNVYGTVTIKNNASTGGQDVVITINPQAKPKPTPKPDNGGDSKPANNGGGSGGSTGILTLIGLLGIALKRKFF